MFIYVITNSTTGKIYIGQHKKNNLKKYLQTKLSDAAKFRGGQSRLYNSMRKHSKEVWSIEPLMEVETKEELDRLERLLIALYDTRNPEVGYNICKGGEGFTGKHTDEWKRNHSAMMKGRVYSPEAIARMKAAPKSEAQLNNLKRAKDPDVVAKRTERYTTDPDYRAQIAYTSKQRWTEPAYRSKMVEKLDAARVARWDKYRKEDTLTARIVELRQKGVTHRAIAHELGIGKSTVNSHLKLAETSASLVY